MQEVAERIEEWIRSKVRQANAKGVVVGMSGGVDSSVVAVLAKHSLGKNVLGLVMPCDSPPKDAQRAAGVAKRFRIRTESVDLSRIMESLCNTLPGADRKTLGNLKSRLRMAVLYYYSNKNRYLVLGTSNRTEMRIGYFTKYGDGGADLEPLGDLYKTQVMELARYLGIPDSVLRNPPTAGLWKGQTDKGEIGMDYEKLDKIIRAIDSRGKPGADPRIVAKIKKMVKKSEHKRRLPEVCEIANF